MASNLKCYKRNNNGTVNSCNGGANIAILRGVISHGQLLPIPDGYDASECIFLLQPMQVWNSDSGDLLGFECYVDSNRKAHIATEGGAGDNKGFLLYDWDKRRNYQKK